MLVSALFRAGLVALAQQTVPTLQISRRLGQLSKTSQTLYSLQLGRVLAGMVFVWLLAPLLFEFLWKKFSALSGAVPLTFVLTLIILTLLYLILAERVPDELAKARAKSILTVLAFPFRLWQIVVYPLVKGLIGLEHLILRQSQEDLQATEDNVKRLLDEGSSRLGEHEQQLIGNVIDFGDTAAHEMMVPRPDVTWISTEQSIEQVFKQVAQSGHTRFPVCEGSPDAVIGYLHAKDLAFAQLDKQPGKIDLKDLTRPVSFVPESAKATNLLHRFQQEGSHLAVVVDEFGGMSGIITLEDLLEELVGEIRDEFDDEELEIERLGGGDLLVDGALRLEDLEEVSGLAFGEVEEETVGGFIFGRLAREVKPGDEIRIEGAFLRVEAVEGLRVTRVRAMLPQKSAQSADSAQGDIASSAQAFLNAPELGSESG